MTSTITQSGQMAVFMIKFHRKEIIPVTPIPTPHAMSITI